MYAFTPAKEEVLKAWSVCCVLIRGGEGGDGEGIGREKDEGGDGKRNREGIGQGEGR